MSESRIYNFSAGPAVLPLPVLEEARRDLVALPGVGMSVMEISHRSKTFDEIIQAAEADLRKLGGSDHPMGPGRQRREADHHVSIGHDAFQAGQLCTDGQR